MRFFILSVCGCFLAGCSTTAHLYPENDAATQIGVVTGKFVAHGTGHVNITAQMPDGENMQGEASILRGGEMGFGISNASVYGSRAYANASGISIASEIPEASGGQAALYGDRGTTIFCDFGNDNMGGHGYGTCHSNKGAVWRLQY
jgi:hypothetical protein